MVLLNKLMITGLIILTPMASFAVDSIYCPGKQGFIKLGMSSTQVLAACGQPTVKQQTKAPLTEKIKVMQLIYSNLNTDAVYEGYNNVYKMWSLPSGSLGVTLQVDIMDNKVSGISINGSKDNSMSICKNEFIQIGDPVDKVFSYCGSPGNVSENFIEQAIPSKKKPEIWIYQVDKFQPIITLTIVDGTLEEIN